MKWNRLMVIVSLALHQANTIQAHIASFSKINSLDPGSEEIMIIEENIEPENFARRPKSNEPSRSFSHLYDNRWNQDHPKMMKKMIKRMEMEGDDQHQTNPIRKRQNNGGVIVPYKGGRVAAGGAGGGSGGAGKKRFGKGAKVAAGVGGAVALGGVVAGAVHLAKNKRDVEEVQMIKRNGKRGGRRKRIAAQERAREGTNVANQKAGTTTPKTGMGKGKAAMLVAGGAAAGAAVMHTVGNSKGGGGGDPNAAAAAAASQ